MKKAWPMGIALFLMIVAMSGCPSPGDGGGPTVYTAGYYNNVACYWTGTTKADLPGAPIAKAYSIYVSGGTVYTAGYHWNGTTYVACYWTGTTLTDLGDGTHLAYATSIYVSGARFTPRGTITAERHV